MKCTVRFCREELRGMARFLAPGILALILTVVATTLLPRWLERGIAILKQSGAAGLAPADASALATVAWVIIGLGVTLGLFRTASRILIFIPGRRAEASLRQRYYDSLTVLPPAVAGRYDTGDLISRGLNDVASVRVMVAMGVLHSINTVLMVTLCLYHMLRISPLLTLVCLLPAPLAQTFVRRLSTAMMDRSREVARMLGDVSERVREIFGAHTLIGIYPVFDRLFDRFMAANDDYRRKNEAWTRLRAMAFMGVGGLATLSQWLLLIVGGHMILKRDAIAIEAFVAFSAYLALVQDPIRAMTWLVTAFQRGEACLERIYEIVDAADGYRRAQGRRAAADRAALEAAADPAAPLLAVRELVFRYPTADGGGAGAGAFVLDVPRLRLDAGRRYGIFGPVGCGKTTLADILSGSLPAPPHTCFYRGLEYGQIADALLRRQFARAPQESRHFARTIRANIEQVLANPVYAGDAAGMPRATFEGALRISCLQSDLDGFPDGLDSMLGENGLNLSGGQKQRLSLMRSLVKPHAVLVLDDIISSVDHRTETRMLERLYAGLAPETCLLFISHRVSALIPCDEILFMQEGRITDRGTHAALLERQPIYRRAFEHQILEQRIEARAHGG